MAPKYPIPLRFDMPPQKDKQIENIIRQKMASTSKHIIQLGMSEKDVSFAIQLPCPSELSRSAWAAACEALSLATKEIMSSELGSGWPFLIHSSTLEFKSVAGRTDVQYRKYIYLLFKIDQLDPLIIAI